MRSLLLLLLLPACDPTLAPDPPTPLPYSATAFSIANNHTLLATSMTIESLGTSIPSETDSDGNALPVMLPNMVGVAVGRAHACALSPGGNVYCWGDQSHGALGLARTCTPPMTDGGLPNCKLGPAAIPQLPPPHALVAGDDITCAQLADDRVVCWGDPNRTGGSALPALGPPSPVKLADGTPLAAARLVASHGTVCAIDRDATLWCWGDGFGPLPQRQPQHGVIDIAIGTHHSCIIDDGGLSCWGEDRNGQVGDIAFARQCGDGPCAIAEPYHLDLDVIRVVVGERHTCALSSDSTVYCWGSNEVGQLGRDDAFLVGEVGVAFSGVVQLQAGYAQTCAMGGDTVWCWGTTSKTDPSEVRP